MIPGRTVSEPGCVFCGIVAHAEPATIAREWPEAVAFVPLNPVTAGHLLVVPHEHVRDAVERPFVTAMTMARAAELAGGYSASNIHIHIVPRVAGDQLMVPWGTTGDPHDPHWCKVAEVLATELASLR
ncbi:MAG: HIT family protein [Mycobacterium sp.]